MIFARRAAMKGFRYALTHAEQTLTEMAADHERAGESAKAEVLREAVGQIGTLQADLP